MSGGLYFVEKRFGRFRLADIYLVQNHYAVSQVMQNVIVLRAEHLMAERCVEYVAWSEMFEIVPDGVMIPFYEVEMDGLKVMFKEVLR